MVDAANKNGISIGVVLGHAIAHDVGHVLLRTTSHRRAGLMSGGWDALQFPTIRTSGMSFDKADARWMQAQIRGEGCPHD